MGAVHLGSLSKLGRIGETTLGLVARLEEDMALEWITDGIKQRTVDGREVIVTFGSSGDESENVEFDQFEALTGKLVQVPKPEWTTSWRSHSV